MVNRLQVVVQRGVCSDMQKDQRFLVNKCAYNQQFRITTIAMYNLIKNLKFRDSNIFCFILL